MKLMVKVMNIFFSYVNTTNIAPDVFSFIIKLVISLFLSRLFLLIGGSFNIKVRFYLILFEYVGPFSL